MEENKTIKERVDIAAKNLNARNVFYSNSNDLITLASQGIATSLYIELFGVAPQIAIENTSIHHLGRRPDGLFDKDGDSIQEDPSKKALKFQFIGTTFEDYCYSNNYANPNKIGEELKEKISLILTEILHKDGDNYIQFAEIFRERFILDGGVIIDFQYKDMKSSNVTVTVFAEKRALADEIAKEFSIFQTLFKE